MEDGYKSFVRDVAQYAHGSITLTEKGATLLWNCASNIQRQLDAGMISGTLEERYLRSVPGWAEDHKHTIWG